MTLRVYNTLTRQKEPFETVRPGHVGMYLCGPTVYKPSHLGHMVGPVIFDTVKRFLVYCGYQVTFVVNITDVDDKLIVQAQKQGTTVTELAERVTADYLDCLKRLGVDGIDHFPRATQHIPDILKLIEGLIAKGYAYAASGDVYFDVSKDPDYGKLCHRDPEQLEAGARIEVSDKKRNPGDFALWKGAKPGEPKWESPWGPGRPGWHIECSAMSMTLLGKTLDIHGGGLDLQFPHHENELAQSESYHDAPFVRYWMHNGLMKVGTGKMSKSQGNEIVVSELIQRHQPETLRFFLLTTHYRRPIDFGEDRLEEVKRGLDGFYRFFERYERIAGVSFHGLSAPTRRAEFDAGGKHSEFLAAIAAHRAAFLECMDDDFNTGGAIGVLYELLTTLNRFADVEKLEGGNAEPRDDFLRGALQLKELSQVLGIFKSPVEKARSVIDEVVERLTDFLRELQNGSTPGPGENDLPGLMNTLKELRDEARRKKKFAIADKIRKGCLEAGVLLEDRAGGTGWRLKDG